MMFYPNRYQAIEAALTVYSSRSDFVVVKVRGGYAVMSVSDYRIWCLRSEEAE